MIGADTNVLVRFLIRDDLVQYAKVIDEIDRRTPDDPLFISREVTIETWWALEQVYKLPRGEIIDLFDGLLNANRISFENEAELADALAHCIAKRDNLADHLIARSGHAAGCRHTLTFDRTAAKIPGMKLLA